MKAGAHPALALDRVRYVGDHVAVVLADSIEQARDAAELVLVDYEPLAAAVRLTGAQASGQPQLHDEAPNNTVYQWHLGEKTAVEEAFAKAVHRTKLEFSNNRLIPNAIEPRAAIAEYDAASESYTLYTTSQNPHVTRLVLSAFIGIAPENRLRVIAPDVGGGFGSKIFIYAEEVVCTWAARKIGRPVNGWRIAANPLSRTRMVAIITPLRKPRWIRERKDSCVPGQDAKPISALISPPSHHLCRPISMRPCSRANTISPRSIAKSTACTPTPRQWTPIVARGVRKRHLSIERLVEAAAREMGIDPAEFRMRNFIRKFPHQTPVLSNYDAGNYPACMKLAVENSRV